MISRWRSPPAGTRYRTGAPNAGRGPVRAGDSARNRLPSSGGPLRPTAGARHDARPSSASPAAAHRGGAGRLHAAAGRCRGHGAADRQRRGPQRKRWAVVKAMASKRVVFMDMPPSWPQHAALWQEYRAVRVNEYGCRRYVPEQTARRAVAALNGSPGTARGRIRCGPASAQRQEKDPAGGRPGPRAMQPMRTPHLPARPGPKAHRGNRSCRNGTAAAPARRPALHPTRLRQAALAFKLLRAGRKRGLGLPQSLQHDAVKGRESGICIGAGRRDAGLGYAAVGPVP